MTLTRYLRQIGIVTTIIALLLAAGLDQLWYILGAIVLGVLTWMGMTWCWTWAETWFLVGVALLTTIGSLASFSPVFLIVAMLAAIATWDLRRFEQRFQPFPQPADIQVMEKRHLKLLALALAAGGILALAVIWIRAQLNFYVLLALAVGLVISLGRLFRMLRSE